jgi:hypothetical protein
VFVVGPRTETVGLPPTPTALRGAPNGNEVLHELRADMERILKLKTSAAVD